MTSQPRILTPVEATTAGLALGVDGLAAFFLDMVRGAGRRLQGMG